MKKKTNIERTIMEIGNVRAKNNHLWMELLKIAIEAEPHLTRDVLVEINGNDLMISKLLAELAQ